MKLNLPAVRDELPGWALRGGLSSLYSLLWALMAGFNQPAEIAGMALGVGVWVLLFAAGCAWLLQAGRTEWARALGVAVGIKFLLLLLGFPVLFLLGRIVAPGLSSQLGYLVNLDMALGMAALWLVGQIAHADISLLNSFGWTALTTIVEGALMAVVISLIALVVLGWWRLRAPALKQELSTARISG